MVMDVVYNWNVQRFRGESKNIVNVYGGYVTL